MQGRKHDPSYIQRGFKQAWIILLRWGFRNASGFLPPVTHAQNGEIAMLGEITHLQAIIDDLTVLTTDPHKLPPASEQVTRPHPSSFVEKVKKKFLLNLFLIF